MHSTEDRNSVHGNALAVIVPVYNAADTLPRLLDSLKGQTFRDFTVLFVDDGSTDASAEIIRGESVRDARFVLLKGRHSGPGPARNVGLDEADRLGVSYVTFVDADDMPAPDMLETAVDAIERSNADIVHYQWSETPGGQPHRDSVGCPSIYVWNKLYRREAIAGIRFVPSHFAEDLAFFLETSLRAPHRLGLATVLYIHTRREGSLWETRNPAEVAHSLRMVISHITARMKNCSNTAVVGSWRSFYLLKLLLQWGRSLKRNLRTVREQAYGDYLLFVDELARNGWLNPLTCGRRGFRRCLKIRLFLVFLHCRRQVRCLRERLGMWLLRRRYTRNLVRLRRVAGKRPVRVLFLVSDVCKWKCQSVYEAMAKSRLYEPQVLVDVTTDELKLSRERRAEIFRGRAEYFRRNGLTVLEAYDWRTDRLLPLKDFRPEILFYQQPWQMPKDRLPASASRLALTCYVPYYVMVFENANVNCREPFLREVWAYFVLGSGWLDYFARGMRELPHVSELVATGNPILDLLGNSPVPDRTPLGPVVYAPHWTLNASGATYLYPIGTFEWSGRKVLEYAKRHPLGGWIFKPHPKLRDNLVRTGHMSEAEAEAYYAEWGRVGEVCLDGDYAKLFVSSRAMITDSGSFLVEYSATGKPLVQLVATPESVPCEPHRRLWSSFYRVRTQDELEAALDDLLENGNDVRREERLAAVRDEGLRSGCAAENILRFLDAKLAEEKCKD